MWSRPRSRLILVAIAVFLVGVLFRWNAEVDLKGLVY